MKKIIKKLIPEFILVARQRHLGILPDLKYKDRNPKDIFGAVYSNGLWGKNEDSANKFWSGEGTHDQYVVETYIQAIKDFLFSFSGEVDVVDLGCGDFFVGSKIRQFCRKYIACDVVDSLISWNKEKYKDLQVEFLVVDITADTLPEGDVVFVRQVLQHLSNAQIKRFLQNIKGKYKYMIITEHLPFERKFTPNIDKPAGPNTRLGLGKYGSGIIITEPPFNYPVKESKLLCEAESEGGLIQTILYTF